MDYGRPDAGTFLAFYYARRASNPLDSSNPLWANPGSLYPSFIPAGENGFAGYPPFTQSYAFALREVPRTDTTFISGENSFTFDYPVDITTSQDQIDVLRDYGFQDLPALGDPLEAFCVGILPPIDTRPAFRPDPSLIVLAAQKSPADSSSYFQCSAEGQNPTPTFRPLEDTLEDIGSPLDLCIEVEGSTTKSFTCPVPAPTDDETPLQKIGSYPSTAANDCFYMHWDGELLLFVVWCVCI